jgi:hypothetical protein
VTRLLVDHRHLTDEEYAVLGPAKLQLLRGCRPSRCECSRWKPDIEDTS